MPCREPSPGRKLDNVWVHFVRHVYKEGYQRECLACKDKILMKEHLLWKHLSQCPQDGKKMKQEDKSADKGQQMFQVRQSYFLKKSGQIFHVRSNPNVQLKEHQFLDTKLMRAVASAICRFG